MKFQGVAKLLPEWENALLAVVAATLLTLAFPDFEIWLLAWFALVPLLWAVEREKLSVARSFVLGWIFGTVFFFGTCWWLTYAPITYANFPPLFAYFLLICVTAIAGLFPGLFTALYGYSLRRLGPVGVLATPIIWVFSEFSRYWMTGNNWNALGYSQAFGRSSVLDLAGVGGVYLSGACVVLVSSCLYLVLAYRERPRLKYIVGAAALAVLLGLFLFDRTVGKSDGPHGMTYVVAIQPNVPMNGLTYEKWILVRQEHVALAESALANITGRQTYHLGPTTVIFPESPMNFTYGEDPEFQQFVKAFADGHNVNVLLNSAEPDPENKKYFNSAVLVDTQGKEIAQYDKIYLVPFGESVPAPLQSIVPAFVGSFSYGKKYDLLPIGEAKAGVMICFESHFGQLSREFVRRGADVLVEMTNDGYLGPTPVLRQHLANAIFRAVETNRPVLRVTNVGITAYINERGEVLDPTQSYTEDTRIWTVSRSDGVQTFYVKYGDWLAWLCTMLTIVLLCFAIVRGTPSGQTEK